MKTRIRIGWPSALPHDHRFNQEHQVSEFVWDKPGPKIFRINLSEIAWRKSTTREHQGTMKRVGLANVYSRTLVFGGPASRALAAFNRD